MRHDIETSDGAMEREEFLEKALRSLPARMAPAGLTTSLRVIASRERQRRLERRTWRQALAAWYERTCLLTSDVMRPLALPFAGGVVSAIVLFSAWLVPTYPLQARSGYDIPTMLTTEATLKGNAPMSVSGGDVVVDITVNSDGRTGDYDIVSIGDQLKDPGVRHRLKSFLAFSEFVPATAFGQPMSGKVRVPISASQINFYY